MPRDEDALVRRFDELAGPPSPAVRRGIGDDAAVLLPLGGSELVWTVDSLEEGIDFHRDWLTFEEVGARAVAAALSDLAASAARPVAILLALGSGASDPAAELLELFRGAAAAARRWDAPVAGGDVTRRERGVGVSVSALGVVDAGRSLRRDGAHPGDEIWVTGFLGRAAAGLELLRERGRGAAENIDPAAVRAFVAPAPRLAEATWVAQRAPLSAGMDLSDGLARDLHRLCAASGVGAVLDAERIRGVAHATDERGIERALYGGEDFELLLVAPARALASLADEMERRFATPLRHIGEIVSGAGVRLHRGGRAWQLAASGFDHLQPPFGEPVTGDSRGEESP